MEPRADPDTVHAAVWAAYYRYAGAAAVPAAADEGAAVRAHRNGVDAGGAGVSGVPGAEPLVHALIANYGGWDIDTMMRIVRCESSFRNEALGGPNYDGLYDHGLYQLHGDPRGHDPVLATAIAHEKWQASGYRPWASSEECWG